LTISNNISSITLLEQADKKSPSQLLKDSPASSKTDVSEKYTANNAVIIPQDTAIISKEGYAAALDSKERDSGASKAGSNSSTADNAVINPQDTAVISQKEYPAAPDSKEKDSGASKAASNSSTAQTDSAAGKSGLSPQTSASVDTSELTAAEKQYDKNNDGQLSVMEKQAMSKDIAQKFDIYKNIADI
jgi:hypothetical protein